MCNVYIMVILSSLFGQSHLTYNSFEFSEFVALRLKMSLRWIWRYFLTKKRNKHMLNIQQTKHSKWWVKMFSGCFFFVYSHLALITYLMCDFKAYQFTRTNPIRPYARFHLVLGIWTNLVWSMGIWTTV